MKISYYEAFDLVAEEAVDLLAENNSDNTFLNGFQVEETLNAVLGAERFKKIVKKRNSIKMRFLIAAVVVLAVSAISFADKDIGAQLITDENRYLVGMENVVDSEDVLIKDKEGNIIQGTEIEHPTEEIWKTSTVVERIKDASPPTALTEIGVKNIDGMYVTPEIITWNGNLVILTKEDGTGWYLEKGQSLVMDVDLYPAEIHEGKGQIVAFYKICNGTFYGGGYDDGISIKKHFEMKADKAGEYYIAFQNYSSDSISFKEGTIRMND